MVLLLIAVHAFTVLSLARNLKNEQKKILTLPEIGERMFNINKKMFSQLKVIDRDLKNLKPNYELLLEQKKAHLAISGELDKQVLVAERSMQANKEYVYYLRQSMAVQNKLFVLQKRLKEKQEKSLKLTSEGVQKARESLTLAKETNALGKEGLEVGAKISKQIQKVLGGGLF